MYNEKKVNELELEILRKSVDKLEKILGKNLLQSKKIKNIIKIVENFISKKKLICYGGTAINNILPKEDQFYNLDIELPDYDFFSINAINDAKELANLYYNAGYTEVEAKAGIHTGTYKVYVNFIPVADITQLNIEVFNALKKQAIKINNILYTPPDFLRMSMYLELSRPRGDISRWEKILKRLFLLNKHYPLNNPKCNNISFMRNFQGKKKEVNNLIYLIKKTLVNQGVVFFGAYATSLYNYYNNTSHFDKKSPDFDVLSEEPKKTAIILKETLEVNGYKNVKIYKKPGIGEIIAQHYEVVYGNDSIVYIYKPLACHSYNVIKLNNLNIKVATIDTIMSFYLAFIFSNRKYYDHNRIYCMAQFLFNTQNFNRLKQFGLLKRFSFKCYGNQTTIEDIRAFKSQKFKELKDLKSTDNIYLNEYEKYFLKYTPCNDECKNKETKKTKSLPIKKTIKNKKLTKKANSLPIKNTIKRK